MDIRSFCKEHILILDGAMGTMLQERGLKPGEPPEAFNITHPEIVRLIHRQYFEAGSHLVLTNTLGANRRRLASHGYTAEQIIEAAVQNAREAAKEAHTDGFVALDIGSTGELLAPIGMLTFDDAYELFAEQVRAGVKAGADAIFIETMTDMGEIRCALLAAKENSDLPVFCCMSFEENMKTLFGASLASMALTLTGMGADFIGINCSLGPKEMLAMTEELKKWTHLPIIIKPNAGLPSVVDGKTVYKLSAEDFAEQMSDIVKAGAVCIGGCCGTSPEFIARIAPLAAGKVPEIRSISGVTAVCSSQEALLIDRVRIIGERINPTGKKAFKQALLEHDLDYICEQALEQTEAGAEILDVNIGLPGIDEQAIMTELMGELQQSVKCVLQIDSTDPAVLNAALRVYHGKAIVNSVNAEEASLCQILPVVKKYGAAVIGLTMDEKGIPRTAKERLIIAERILKAARSYGIPASDVFIDCLTLTSGAEQEIAWEAVRAVALVKQHLGLKTVLGISNISFGLPARNKLNQVFLSAAIAHGLDLPIINPNVQEMVDVVYCCHQLKNIDRNSADYVKRFYAETVREESDKDLIYCVRNGLKEQAGELTKTLLQTLPPMSIVDSYLIPALDLVGKDYESGTSFLPQLMLAAEAAKAAFTVINQSLPPRNAEDAKKVILATVEGDVHDIGKNIVKAVLENYGYTILDLGKDVSVEKIVEETLKQHVPLVGLSALMTTTVVNMERTIKALKIAAPNVKIMVGGAVLTPEYAEKIGADYYAKDALAAVQIAKQVF